MVKEEGKIFLGEYAESFTDGGRALFDVVLYSQGNIRGANGKICISHKNTTLEMSKFKCSRRKYPTSNFFGVEK